MNEHSVRALTKPEIDILVHLLRYGGPGCTPVILFAGGREKATGLWRLGMLSVWYRQSTHGGRQEGPFYSLTVIGRQRAVALAAARQTRSKELTIGDLEKRIASVPPPPD